jgi:hypothetical protein
MHRDRVALGSRRFLGEHKWEQAKGQRNAGHNTKADTSKDGHRYARI